MVLPRWHILTAHLATVERILDIIGDCMVAVTLRNLLPDFIPSTTRRPRPQQAWKQETGASVVRGAPTQPTVALVARARAPPMQQPFVQTLPPGGLVPFRAEVNQLRAELVVIPGLQQEISVLTALVESLHATLAKICPDLKLDASHALVEVSTPPQPVGAVDQAAPRPTQQARSLSLPVHPQQLLAAAEIPVPSQIIDMDHDSLGFQDFIGSHSETSMERDASAWLERDRTGDFNNDSGQTVVDMRREAKDTLQFCIDSHMQSAKKARDLAYKGTEDDYWMQRDVALNHVRTAVEIARRNCLPSPILEGLEIDWFNGVQVPTKVPTDRPSRISTPSPPRSRSSRGADTPHPKAPSVHPKVAVARRRLEFDS